MKVVACTARATTPKTALQAAAGARRGAPLLRVARERAEDHRVELRHAILVYGEPGIRHCGVSDRNWALSSPRIGKSVQLLTPDRAKSSKRDLAHHLQQRARDKRQHHHRE